MVKILLVIPVYNEERTLEKSISKLIKYTSKNIHQDLRIIIADNASTDDTARIGKRLEKKYKKVDYLFLKTKGRGNALKYCWTRFDADVYSYCDVDLSTDISCLKALFNGIINGNDIVIGNRLAMESKVKRSLTRTLLSRGYNRLVRLYFKTNVRDFQCGFKAINKSVAKNIVPKLESTNWFFDTELILVSEAKNYKILQIPVIWEENPEIVPRKSKVKIFKIIFEYIGNIVKLKRRMQLNYSSNI